jgi:hypothetical protein
MSLAQKAATSRCTFGMNLSKKSCQAMAARSNVPAHEFSCTDEALAGGRHGDFRPCLRGGSASRRRSRLQHRDGRLRRGTNGPFVPRPDPRPHIPLVGSYGVVSPVPWTAPMNLAASKRRGWWCNPTSPIIETLRDPLPWRLARGRGRARRYRHRHSDANPALARAWNDAGVAGARQR